ncbi:hypothetical protein QT196_21555 [Streptomyces sp. P9-2B-2]|uniref:hypothetical protein n=1 Tax=Streptomyces TaxID=1883 RepID=UPI0022501AE0|nr:MULTISPECIES: hypothetical protein [Streptomyces]MCX4639779.1 hypothetical protein [Streptomyces platensis]WJY39653.1 hypothetical protein QT196_21555 [Streptomyces sp. P9-2B-2]
MSFFSRNTVRSIAVGGALLAAMGATAAYAGGSTSTELDNGRLYFEAHNGRDIGQSSSKFFTGIKYTKTGGGAVTAQLQLHTENIVLKGKVRTVKKGQSIKAGWSSPVSDAPDCKAVGVMRANGEWYETPWVHHLC